MSQGLPAAVQAAQMANQQQFINQLANRGVVVNSQVYMSRGWFVPTRAAGPPVTFTMAKGSSVNLFQYKKGDAISGVVGAPAGYIATFADTTLQQPGQTINGQTVHIYGISIIINPTTDFAFAQRLMPELSVAVGLNGNDQQTYYGTPLNLPGIGGLYGFGGTGVLAPPTNSNYQALGFASNGNPMQQNFREIPEGLIWRPTGNADSNLIVTVNLERAVTLESSVARTEDLDVGITAFTPPADGAVQFDFVCHLLSGTEAQQSVNV